MCNNSFIIHLHRISEEEKIMMKKKAKEAQTWLDLNQHFPGVASEPLYSTAKPRKLCYLVYKYLLMSWQAAKIL